MAECGAAGAVLHRIARPGILGAGARREQEGSADVGRSLVRSSAQRARVSGRHVAPRRTENRQRNPDEVCRLHRAGKSGGASHDRDRVVGSCGTLWQRRRQRVDGRNPAAGKSARHRARTRIADIDQRGVRSTEPGGGVEALLSRRCSRRWLRSTASKPSARVRRRVCGRASAPKSACRNSSKKRCAADRYADGMVEILALMPKTTLHYVTNRFGHCGFREDCELLGEIVHTLGEEATQSIDGSAANRACVRGRGNRRFADAACARRCREDFAGAPVAMAAQRARPHDAAAFFGAGRSSRATSLCALYDSLDPMIRPLAIDEMGMSGHHDCIPKLLDLAQDDTTPGFHARESDRSAGPFARGRGRAVAAAHHGSRQLWRWSPSRRIAHRGRASADAYRPDDGAGKTGAQRPRSQGFDAGADRSRSEHFGDSPAAIRATEVVAQSRRGLTTNLRENIGSRFPNSISAAASAPAIGIWRRARCCP